jgi:macrodomain Ter protein organizer (MatP/YcbG family)
MTKRQETERTEAIEKIKGMIAEGQTLYTIIRHRSTSGMSRSISVFRIKDNEPYELDYWISRALDRRIDGKHGGVIEKGAGMDMGFHLVYCLGQALYGDGYKLNQRWL